jgi:hypothetical protein
MARRMADGLFTKPSNLVGRIHQEIGTEPAGLARVLDLLTGIAFNRDFVARGSKDNVAQRSGSGGKRTALSQNFHN